MRSTLVKQASELAGVLRGTLVAIEAGELEAPAETRHRIEGALTACRVLAGEDPAGIIEDLSSLLV